MRRPLDDTVSRDGEDHNQPNKRQRTGDEGSRWPPRPDSQPPGSGNAGWNTQNQPAQGFSNEPFGSYEPFSMVQTLRDWGANQLGPDNTPLTDLASSNPAAPPPPPGSSLLHAAGTPDDSAAAGASGSAPGGVKRANQGGLVHTRRPPPVAGSEQALTQQLVGNRWQNNEARKEAVAAEYMLSLTPSPSVTHMVRPFSFQQFRI